MPPNCIVDDAAKNRGTVCGLIGAEVFRKQIAAGEIALPAERPTPPKGFTEQKRDGVRTIIGHPSPTSDDEPQQR